MLVPRSGRSGVSRFPNACAPVLSPEGSPADRSDGGKVPYSRRMSDDGPGEDVLQDAVESSRRRLGDRLVAAYALGSLAHGGFSALVSDVDLGLVLADPLRKSDDGVVQAIADTVKRGASPLHGRLSIFWGTPSTLRGHVEGGRFPPLDRLDLLEHGRLLLGNDIRGDTPRPAPAELLIVGAEFALDFLAGRSTSAGSRLGSMVPGEDASEEIRQPELLVSRGPRRLTKIILFPVRFLFTAATGRVGTNDLAVEHYINRPAAPFVDLVRAALSWRINGPGPDAAGLVGRELSPLYLYYIDDHAPRLLRAGRPDLVEAFRRWRSRILA
jgi:hypothetical protein